MVWIQAILSLEILFIIFSFNERSNILDYFLCSFFFSWEDLDLLLRPAPNQLGVFQPIYKSVCCISQLSKRTGRIYAPSNILFKEIRGQDRIAVGSEIQDPGYNILIALIRFVFSLDYNDLGYFIVR